MIPGSIAQRIAETRDMENIALTFGPNQTQASSSDLQVQWLLNFDAIKMTLMFAAGSKWLRAVKADILRNLPKIVHQSFVVIQVSSRCAKPCWKAASSDSPIDGSLP